MPTHPEAAARLAALRAELARQGADAFLLQRTDGHGSEYLPANAERVAWLTGFTGSAAQVVVLAERAAVFTDGRYTAQLEAEIDAGLFERVHSPTTPVKKWLTTNLPVAARLGLDPFLTRDGERQRLEKVVAGRGGQLIMLDANPVDAVWAGRPAAPLARVEAQDARYAGEATTLKLARIAKAVGEAGAEVLVVTAADAIAWLLNIRGRDIPYNPLCLSFVILDGPERCRWFVDPAKVPAGLALANEIKVVPAADFMTALGEYAGRAVLADPEEVHLGYLLRLRAGGARLVEADDPIFLAKAKKNAAELAGAVDAQRRDGAALVRFLAWLDAQPEGSVSELSAADRLGLERGQDPLFQGESFPPVSAHGPNAALPHYRAAPASNRKLEGGHVYLIDSGGQYLDATTDVTRTIAIGTVPEEAKTRFTLVLKGHIAIAAATFPTGTWGSQVDPLARQALWREGLEFDHGTGHGIGAYLCVHEGPQRLAKTGQTPLEPGMLLSNEPGYYKPGAYGIRIENLVVVEARPKPDGADKEMLGFATITLCPIDRRMIVPGLLDEAQRAWLDAYHARVLAELTPLLPAEADRAWLTAACAPC